MTKAQSNTLYKLCSLQINSRARPNTVVPIQLKDVGCMRFYNRVCLAQTFGLSYILRSTTTTSECFEFMGRDVKTERRKILLNFWQFSLTKVFPVYPHLYSVSEEWAICVCRAAHCSLFVCFPLFRGFFFHLALFWGAFKRLFVYIVQYLLVYHRRFIMSLDTGSKSINI